MQADACTGFDNIFPFLPSSVREGVKKLGYNSILSPTLAFHLYVVSLVFCYFPVNTQRLLNLTIILEGGHDSKEDALACLDLMKMKVKEEVKRLQKKARKQAMYEGGPDG